MPGIEHQKGSIPDTMHSATSALLPFSICLVDDVSAKALNHKSGTTLVVQWLRLHAPNAGDTGSIPGWGTKIPHAAEQLGP